jgi:Predicted small secreted protein
MMKTITGLLFAIFFLSACNTIHGVGQDIQRGGEKVKDAATSVQQKL